MPPPPHLAEQPAVVERHGETSGKPFVLAQRQGAKNPDRLVEVGQSRAKALSAAEPDQRVGAIEEARGEEIPLEWVLAGRNLPAESPGRRRSTAAPRPHWGLITVLQQRDTALHLSRCGRIDCVDGGIGHLVIASQLRAAWRGPPERTRSSWVLYAGSTNMNNAATIPAMAIKPNGIINRPRAELFENMRE